MNESRPINPHTGRPYSDEPGPGESPGGQQPIPRDVAPVPPAPAPGASGTEPAAGEGGAPSAQQLAVRAALETVMDPEIGLSVVDLGLIRDIQVGQGLTEIKMLLTTPFCPYAPQMLADVKAAAESAVSQVCNVEILPDPWSPDMMPDPGLLGFSF